VVTDLFGRSPSKSVNPDEAVAIGAAIQVRFYNTLIILKTLLELTQFEIVEQSQVTVDSQTKSTHLDCESVCTLLLSTMLFIGLLLLEG